MDPDSALLIKELWTRQVCPLYGVRLTWKSVGLSGKLCCLRFFFTLESNVKQLQCNCSQVK